MKIHLESENSEYSRLSWLVYNNKCILYLLNTQKIKIDIM